jgi:hypothetical protein
VRQVPELAKEIVARKRREILATIEALGDEVGRNVNE